MATKHEKTKKARELLFKISTDEEKMSFLVDFYGKIEKKVNKYIEALESIKSENIKEISQLSLQTRKEIGSLKSEMNNFLHESHQKIIFQIKDFEEKEGRYKNIKSEEHKKSRGEIDKKIEEIFKELERVNNFKPKSWGGSSRTIYLNGAVISPENLYSDVNFIPGDGVSILAVNNNTTKQVDVTITAGVGSVVRNEVVSGSGTFWTLANTPIANSLQLYANGQRLTPTVDYSISGATITTVLSWSAGTVLADYSY